jgi:hypothetical protein
MGLFGNYNTQVTNFCVFFREPRVSGNHEISMYKFEFNRSEKIIEISEPTPKFLYFAKQQKNYL